MALLTVQIAWILFFLILANPLQKVLLFGYWIVYCNWVFPLHSKQLQRLLNVWQFMLPLWIPTLLSTKRSNHLLIVWTHWFTLLQIPLLRPHLLIHFLVTQKVTLKVLVRVWTTSLPRVEFLLPVIGWKSYSKVCSFPAFCSFVAFL